jgi:hypothetical protein
VRAKRQREKHNNNDDGGRCENLNTPFVPLKSPFSVEKVKLNKGVEKPRRRVF